MIQTVFSRCPVGTATEYIIKKGQLQQALAEVGAEFQCLQDIKDPTITSCHYTQTPPLHFRDGGNIPPLWAQAQGDRCVLLGVSYQQEARGIYVRNDSPIQTIEDLKGKKIALPVRKDAVVDFRFLTMLRGFEEAFAYKGMELKEEQKVYVDAANIRMCDVHGGVDGKKDQDFMTADFLAVEQGQADAAFGNSIKAVRHDQAGLFRNIITPEEQYLIPNNNNNAILLITCTKPFAYEHPEIVIAYLKCLIQAGRYIPTSQEEFLEAAADGVYSATVEEFAKSYHHEELFARVPELTDRSFAQLNDRKEFMLKTGFIKKENDFDVEKWADKSFLEEAMKQV